MENRKEQKISRTNKEAFKRRVYHWTLQLVTFIDTLPRKQSTDVITRQLLRSGTSIGANYVEAQAGSSKKDFANFLSHALKSANESKFWLSLLRDTGKANKKEVEILLAELTQLANILGASLVTLRKK